MTIGSRISGAGVRIVALCSALRAPEGAVFPALTRWHSRLAHGRMGADAQLRAHTIRLASRRCKGAVVLPRGGDGRLTVSVCLMGGNAKGFALSFPEAE